jgi:chemotaxis response regulator CheB
MPQAAIDTGAVDFVLTIAEIADKLVELMQMEQV